jgi:hypothetical protein
MLLAPILVLAACGGSGRVSLAWTIAYSDNTPTVCATGAGETVVVSVDNHSTSFPCDAGFNTTVTSGLIPWGTYTATVSLVDATGATEASGTVPAEVDAGEVTDLGTIAFVLATLPPPPPDGTIELSYQLNSPDAGANPATRACFGDETLVVTLDPSLTPTVINCSSSASASPVDITSVPAGTYANATVALFESGAQEDGPGEQSPFGADNSAAVILGFSVTVTGGQTVAVDATGLFVNRCSLNGTCR